MATYCPIRAVAQSCSSTCSGSWAILKCILLFCLHSVLFLRCCQPMHASQFLVTGPWCFPSSLLPHWLSWYGLTTCLLRALILLPVLYLSSLPCSLLCLQ